MQRDSESLLTLAARIVSAHVGAHETSTRALPALIRGVYQALASVGPMVTARPRPNFAVTGGMAARDERAPSPKSATGRSVFADHLVCLDCGLHMKMLKRHLQTVHGQTPAQYRSKWGLAGDYPMVAREYASLRSTLAIESGLGKRPIAKGR